MGKDAALKAKNDRDEDDDEGGALLQRGPNPPPKPAPPKGAKKVEEPAVALRDAVAAIATQVDRIQHAAAKDRVGMFPATAKEIAGHLRYIETVFGRKALDQAPSLRGKLQQLGTDIAELFRLGRLAHVHMREVHLEEVFDLEDSIRLKAGLERVNRAEKYYDDNASPTTAQPTGRTTDAKTAGDHLDGKSNDPDKKPETRDQFVNAIMDQAGLIRSAISNGYVAAEGAIKAPDAPEEPDLLEALLQVALGFVFSGIDAALGKLIAAGFKRVNNLVGIERTLFEHVGADLKGIIVDSFKDSAKAAIKTTISHPRSGNDADQKVSPDSRVHDNGALDPKSMFLGNAFSIATAATNSALKLYTGYKPELLRMPIGALTAIHEAFDQKVIDDISIAFRDRLVLEWVNFVKTAAQRGSITKGKSKLDQGLEPWGVLDIKLTAVRKGPRTMQPKGHTGSKLDNLDIDDNRPPPVSSLEISDAHLHGMGPGVTYNITKQQKHHTLKSIPIHRRVMVGIDDQVVTVLIGRDGVVTVPPSRPEQLRAMFEIGSSAPEAIKTLLATLNQHSVDRIHG